MKQTARVIEINGDKATVEVERSSACAGCSKSHDCFACKKKIKVTAENTVGADVGDRVIIESPSERILGYAILVFVLPIVISFFAFFISDKLGLSEGLCIAVCALSLIVTLGIELPVLNKNASKKNTIKVICKE